MNQTNFEKWLHDLETTTEPQAQTALTTVGAGDCCLGRMCKLAIADGVQVSVKTSYSANYLSYDGETSVPPRAVQEWLGIKYEAEPDDLYEFGIQLNDFDNLSFKEIATAMREKFDAR